LVSLETNLKADRASALSAFLLIFLPRRPVSFYAFLIGILIVFLPSTSTAQGFETISLKEYKDLAIKVPNPINRMELPRGKSYQVNTKHYVLQFFFNGRNILGVIYQRDPKYPIHVRWCFFRDCEESPFDFKVVIANPHQPPFEDSYFQVKYPPGLQYQFQGLHFTP